MRFAGISAMGDFWRVVREFNPEGIEREATTPLELWVAGEPGVGKRSLVAALAGNSLTARQIGPFRVMDVDHQSHEIVGINRPDILILVARLDMDLAEQGRRTDTMFGRPRIPTILVFTHADATGRTRDERNAAYRAFSFVSHLKTTFVDARNAEEIREKVAPLLLDSLPTARTSMARQLPTLRQTVVEQIIAETCRVNSQFALAANLPANLPFFGGVAGNIADFFVLTKNQVMMVLRISAVYGRDLAPTMQVAGELAPIIGGGILWRSVARMATGMMPTLFAAAPKTAIAYVGTYVAGQAARYYFDEGRKPPKELMQQFGAEGARLYRTHFA